MLFQFADRAVVEALVLSCDDFPINKSSIQRIHTQSRKDRTESIKSDGKLLPELDVRSFKEERLPILISFGEKEQLLAVPKLESLSGQDQAKAVLNAFYDWNVDEKVQIMCCDTTVFNTGRLKGACVLLEQKSDRELVRFACRHHVYELVLKCVLEAKIHQITSSSDIKMLTKFRYNWKTINLAAIETYTDIVIQHFCYTTIQ
ncbi:unnamed protein product [Psylliodes chrysocephalus]|uniref:Uncharacterized protein n=1 Tax=Psylliodes chrysocephalus TaxID=3402493 RepID=A0A9P0CI94_9CUCU|nr:unnamed protein product [Psylliodes chrysocephala]